MELYPTERSVRVVGDILEGETAVGDRFDGETVVGDKFDGETVLGETLNEGEVTSMASSSCRGWVVASISFGAQASSSCLK